MAILKQRLIISYLEKHKIGGILGAVISLILTVMLIYFIPYENTVITYLVILAYFVTPLITFLLYVPLGLLLRIFNKQIPAIICNLFTLILDIVSVICYIWILPLFIIAAVYIILLVKPFYYLFIILAILLCIMGTKILNNNKILSQGITIEQIIEIRREWMKQYGKIAVFTFIVFVSIMICGILQHKFFSVVDCVIISLFVLITFYRYLFGTFSTTYNKIYSTKDFIFFLRSFKIDDLTESNILSDIHDGITYKNRNFRILRIGNPLLQMHAPDIGVDTFFLPQDDWQPVVRNYIKDANLIVVLINIPQINKDMPKVNFTQGVIWELYNNFEYNNKFIYCIDNISTQKSDDFLATLDEDKYNSKLTECIVKLIEESDYHYFNRCIFTYNGEECICFKDIKTAVKYKLDDDIFEGDILHAFFV